MESWKLLKFLPWVSVKQFGLQADPVESGWQIAEVICETQKSGCFKDRQIGEEFVLEISMLT